MKLDKKAETLAGVIVAVLILSIAMFGVLSIVNFNRTVMTEYTDTIGTTMLQGNSKNIVAKLDLSEINDNEIFYILKNEESSSYEIYTGGLNEQYKYVDVFGNNVNPLNFEGKIYIREFLKTPNATQYSITPDRINNLAFHFDGMNIDSLKNQAFNSGSFISFWKNLKNNTNIEFVYTAPILNNDEINGNPLVGFSGNGKFVLSSDSLITGELSCEIEPNLFEQKSFSLFFKTGEDIINEQIILKQGNDNIGYSFYIENNEFYAKIINNQTSTKYWCSTNTESYSWPAGNKEKTINFGKILANTIYSITIVHDSSSKDSEGNYIGSQNTFKVYQNGILRGTLFDIFPQAEHQNLAIGGDTVTDMKYFKGKIGELISWNYSLNENEVRSINNYFNEKWSNNTINNKYNIIETRIIEYNNN